MKIKNEQFFLTIKKFLQVYLVKNRSCSLNTVKSYRESLNLFFQFMQEIKHVPLVKVEWECFTYDNITGFLEWLLNVRCCGKQTQIQRLTALRSFVRYAGIIDIASVSAQASLEKIKLRRPPSKQVCYLSKNALALLLKQPNQAKQNGLRDLVFLTLMYDTAARCQELVDLKLKDLMLDTKTQCVYINGKGGKTRVVPILPKTVEHLKHYLVKFHSPDLDSPDDCLFYTVSHGIRHRMSEDTVGAFTKKYGAAAKLLLPEIPKRVHPHMLRHTRAMHWYQDGMPLTILSDILGHSQLETTRIYASADINMKREAIRKANYIAPTDIPEAIWKNDEDMIRKLSGLKG